MRYVFGLALLLAQGMTPEEHVEAARAAEAAGRFAEAERHYEQVLASRPVPEIFQRLGLVRHLQGKFAEAIPPLEKAVAGDPKLWGAHLFLGIAFYRTNQFDKALTHLETAQKLEPGQRETEFWLGAAHFALKQHLDGLIALERLAQRGGSDAEVLRLLAQNYADYGTKLWNGVAERHFDTAAGQEVHGRALELEGADEEALSAYGRALELAPGRAGIHLAMGRLHLRKGRIKEAIREFDAELRLRPDDPDALALKKEAIRRR